MKYKNLPHLPGVLVCDSYPGIVIFDLTRSSTKIEVSRLLKEIEKALYNQRVKVILRLSIDASIGVTGFAYIEKALRDLKAFAQSQHGDIRYVLPKQLSERIPGSVSELNDAIQSLSTATSNQAYILENIKLKEKIISQDAQIKRLTAQVDILTKKTKELMSIIIQPSTDQELRAAIDHFRRLASEIQIISPIGLVKDE